MARQLLRVGLTGGLACGKSTVLRGLAELGAATVDSDTLARAILDQGSPHLAAVARALGDSVLRDDGSLDRALVADIVFADPSRRAALEAIVHPEVERRREAAFARFASDGRAIAVADIPLLYEAGLETGFDRIVVVTCRPATQLARAVARGMSPADARARIAAQLPADVKAARADYVIDSEGVKTQTAAQTRAIWKRLGEDAERLRNGGPL